MDKFVEFTNEDIDIQPPYKLVLLLSLSFVFIVKVMKPLHDVPEASIIWFAIYHSHYKEKLETTKSIYNPSLLQFLLKLISLLSVLFDYVVKFATHHPHYKDIVGNQTRTFIYAINCLSILCGWSNLLAAIFTYNGGAYITKPGLVMKERELPRTSLHLLSHEPPFLLFSLTLSKMRLVMFKYSLISEYLAILKCTAISKWQLSLTLTSISLLADYPSVKLTSENVIKAAKDCKYLTSTVTISPYVHILLSSMVT